jgi:3-oxoacyl-[acyl-carrier-protein] synthase-3
MKKGSTWTATITGIGAYVPDSRLTNADLEKIVDTSDEWIVQRTGIRERRICAPDQYTSDLCQAAVSDMLARYPVHLDDTELVIVATHTPDFPFPPVSCQIQDRFGLSMAGALDLNATCAGFVYALHLANGLVSAGIQSKILVIGADAMSKITDYTDRSTCILFGDGAGAVLIERKREEEHPEAIFLGSHLGADGSGGIHLYRTGIANEMNGIPLTDTKRLVQNGREVYKWAAYIKLMYAAAFVPFCSKRAPVTLSFSDSCERSANFCFMRSSNSCSVRSIENSKLFAISAIFCLNETGS